MLNSTEPRSETFGTPQQFLYPEHRDASLRQITGFSRPPAMHTFSQALTRESQAGGSCAVLHPPPSALIRITLASIRRRMMSMSFLSSFKAAVCQIIT